jgi:hypothetical protein
MAQARSPWKADPKLIPARERFPIETIFPRTDKIRIHYEIRFKMGQTQQVQLHEIY